MNEILQLNFKTTRRAMMRKLKMTSGRSQENSFVVITLYPESYVPREETFPVPMKYIDVTRTTCTSLDVLLEKHIEDYWNVEKKNCQMQGQDLQDSFY